MPISSPDDPVATIEGLGLPGRAVTALTRAGITDVAALAALTRRELSAIAGLGPGMVAAIRAVVPEPPTRLPGAGGPGTPAAAPAAADAGSASAEEESPAAPSIPSFDSLRGPRRRSAVDLLLPDAPAPETGSPEVPSPGTGSPRPSPSRPPSARPAPAAPAGPAPVRPPDYADLLRLGVHVARAVLTAPARCLRRLLG
ncbi:DNA-directed RNA polymerase subunit alpha C-terminal domain-containing protein [Blastococcus sp. SYSU DS0539]